MYLFNGKLTEEPPQIPLNRSTYFGESFFTSFLVKDKKVFNLDAHFQRLQESLNLFYPQIKSVNKEEILQKLRMYIPVKGNFKVRLTFFTDLKVTQLYELIEFTNLSNNIEAPLKTVSKKLSQSNERDCTNIKLGQYSWENFYLSKLPGYDIMRISDDDQILDLTKSNILFLQGNEFVLPLANVLQGTTLNIFKEFQEKKIIEREIYYDEISEFDGAFSLNAVRLLRPIRKIDDLEYSRDKTQKYIKTFSKYIDNISRNI